MKFELYKILDFAKRMDAVAKVLLVIAASEIGIGLMSIIIFYKIYWHGLPGWTKDAYPVMLASLQTTATAIVAFGGLFTMASAIAPRSLSIFGFGPKLIIEFYPEKDGGYVVNWDRLLLGNLSKAILIRLAIHNIGVSAAESVEITLEKIEHKGSGKSEYNKPSRLRWADSYDLDRIDKLEFHRCNNVVEPLIHAGTKHFVDFAFIFDPSSSKFYDKIKAGRSDGYWCIHPFYQWLLAQDDLKLLEPSQHEDSRFLLSIVVSCKNAHLKRVTIEVQCCPQESMTSGSLNTSLVSSFNPSPVPLTLA